MDKRMLPIMDLPGTVSILSEDTRYVWFLIIIVLFFTMTPYCLYSRGLKDLDPSTVNILCSWISPHWRWRD